MKTALVLAFAALAIAAVAADAVSLPRPPRPEPPLPQPVFRPAQERAGEHPVKVECRREIVEDNGLLRKVSASIVFTNPNQRVFEGELELPLPDRAAVCGYALEVNGTMVPGVVVGKDEARIAFENEKRQGVDPGIVEHVKGNVWRTRIYPLNPNTPRRAAVTVIGVQLLATSAAAGSADWESAGLPPRSLLLLIPLLAVPVFVVLFLCVLEGRFYERPCHAVPLLCFYAAAFFTARANRNKGNSDSSVAGQ